MVTMLIYLSFLAALIYWLGGESQLELKVLKFNKNPGQDLEEWLKRFNWERTTLNSSEVELPRYKFYSEVVETLLLLARKMGGKYQDSILFLREGLQTDLQSEKKNRELIFGTLFQMSFMVVVTWGFIAGASMLVEVKMNSMILVSIFAWQMLGLFSLLWLIKYFRKKYFQEIGTLWKVLFVMKSLSKVPISRSEILQLAGASEIEKIGQKNLQPLIEKLMHICQKSREQGFNSEYELSTLMNELRFIEKWHFELFEKRLVTVKLCLMAFFFLPSYLAFIFNLLGDLLALM